jgi:hypothetical protein
VDQPGPTCIDVYEPGKRPRKGWHPCQIGKHVRFSSDHLQSYCFAQWDETVYDALLVAAVVEFCDRVERRPAYTWSRDFRVRIPVHSPAIWNRSDVKESLIEALTFLTGDTWEFEFFQRQKAAEKPLQHNMPLPSGLEAVIPFSDGLDSRAVGRLTELELGKALIRVRIGTGSWDQATLAKQPSHFTSIPYKVRTSGSEFAESSARSRGFKFTLISGLASYLSKAPRVIMTESGQGALGPSLVPVGQAYEDYRNHPLFTRRMEKFISSLLGWTVRFEFPRLWETKAQTLRLFIEQCQDSFALIDTRSCWQGSRQVGVNGVRRQCGICAACLLRRMSLHAAGIPEPQTNYVWENLRSARFCDGVAEGFSRDRITSSFREYAIGGALHLDQLATLNESVLNARRLKASASSLSATLGISRTDAESRLTLLLNQHSAEWKNFMQSLGNDSFMTKWTETPQ